MNVLAIFTALPELCVAAEGNGGRFLVAAEGRHEQAENILTFMEEAAHSAGFSLKETELVTAAEGPGAFTGLRLGYAAAKAVQLSAACPFIPVPTFDAWGMSLAGCASPLFCVMDAKKKRFYGQFFSQGKPLSEAMDMTAEEAARNAVIFLQRLKNEGEMNVNPPMLSLAGPHARLLASNEGFVAALEEQKLLEQNLALQFLPVPCGGIFSMIDIAKKNYSHYTGSTIDYSIAPVYIRKSDAETAHE